MAKLERAENYYRCAALSLCLFTFSTRLCRQLCNHMDLADAWSCKLHPADVLGCGVFCVVGSPTAYLTPCRSEGFERTAEVVAVRMRELVGAPATPAKSAEQLREDIEELLQWTVCVCCHAWPPLAAH